MLQKVKNELQKEKKFDMLEEVQKEETELLGCIHAIIYWAFGSQDVVMRKGHIIAQCKKMLTLLKKLTQTIDEKFKGPNEINDFKLHISVDKPKHLANIYVENEKIEHDILAILTLVTQASFSFTDVSKERIRKHTLSIIKELDAEEEELDLVLELIEESNNI